MVLAACRYADIFLAIIQRITVSVVGFKLRACETKNLSVHVHQTTLTNRSVLISNGVPYCSELTLYFNRAPLVGVQTLKICIVYRRA